jgi:hypothetical protein
MAAASTAKPTSRDRRLTGSGPLLIAPDLFVIDNHAQEACTHLAAELFAAVDSLDGLILNASSVIRSCGPVRGVRHGQPGKKFDGY